MLRYFLFLIQFPRKRVLLSFLFISAWFAILVGFLLNSVAQPVGEARRLPPLISFSLGFLVVPLLFFRWWWLLLRFGKRIRRFRQLTGNAVTLRYSPNLKGSADLSKLLQECEEILNEFKERFGFGLRRRLVVFLFSAPTDLVRLFRTPVGGVALIGGDAMLLIDPAGGNRVRETIRHELAHLFSHYWGQINPPLKGEGLAVWLQGTLDGKPVDMQALALLLTDRFGYLSWILGSAVFRRTHWYGYILAGSFTSYLIQRFGWDLYCDFFQRSNPRNFKLVFEKLFGLPLVTAERQWRESLISQRQTFEPELSDLIHKQNVVAAFNGWQFYRCADLAEKLIRSGQADIPVVGTAARAHAILGHYERAAELMRQVVQSNHPLFNGDPASAWLFLGRLYDLLSSRDEAISAYQKCLSAPNGFVAVKRRPHALARRHLKRPFTEEEWLKLIKPRTQHSRLALRLS